MACHCSEQKHFLERKKEVIFSYAWRIWDVVGFTYTLNNVAVLSVFV